MEWVENAAGSSARVEGEGGKEIEIGLSCETTVGDRARKLAKNGNRRQAKIAAGWVLGLVAILMLLSQVMLLAGVGQSAWGLSKGGRSEQAISRHEWYTRRKPRPAGDANKGVIREAKKRASARKKAEKKAVKAKKQQLRDAVKYAKAVRRSECVSEGLTSSCKVRKHGKKGKGSGHRKGRKNGKVKVVAVTANMNNVGSATVSDANAPTWNGISGCTCTDYEAQWVATHP